MDVFKLVIPKGSPVLGGDRAEAVTLRTEEETPFVNWRSSLLPKSASKAPIALIKLQDKTIALIKLEARITRTKLLQLK